MNILYLITQADGGGAQRYVLSLAKHFAGEIAAGTESQQLFAEAKELGIQTHPLKYLFRNINPINDTSACLELVFLINKLRPDIIHLNSSKAGFIGSMIKPFIKARIVYTAHGFVFNEPMSAMKKRFYLGLEKSASRYRDFIITVSHADENSALEHKLIAPQKITTIHNGIGSINFLSREAGRTALRLPADKFVFGTIANHYKTKGLDVLIEAVSQLSEEVKSKCQFVIIGLGPELENLKLKIENLKLGDILHLAGPIPNANIYLKSFDIYLLPSRKEGFPYAILDALQAGLPIIASNVGGMPEAVEDAGILVSPEDSHELAETIASLFFDQQKRTLLGQKALERSNLFTEQKMFEETKKVYKGLKI